ncbi:ribosome small subunit-dependent GTPase A [Gordonia amarae]|nr:ribosome small subunit-dependent GTPase A [Gordonia amarae]QHN24234.1 ribosome small subunit-dependent GTPase A [Gordonia amarae]QHN33152.1 ribosome small subunit-dependent GTPase A [Gordonia amarae]QHN41876.1 ribosome small subunit-dependent GTPase A [Gordonia amarae]
MPGRVSRVDRGRCDVHTTVGVLHATVPANVLDLPESGVVTGDWVAIEFGATATVRAVLPRRTALYRASADRTSRRQALVANVDTVIVAAALTGALRPSKIERYLALAWDGGTTPVVVLTKSDIADGHPESAVADLAAAMPGADVLAVSAYTGDGLDELRERLGGSTVILGPSGVGKSTLVNALVGEQRMDTGAVRAGDDKGRHTTVTRELIPIDGGGVLIDTPGLRGIGLHDADDGIGQVYADIEALAAQCRFDDCEHHSEPGCAVQEAIANGTVDAGRLGRYEKMLRESRWAAARGNAREERRQRETWKAITRQQRGAYRFRENNGLR